MLENGNMSAADLAAIVGNNNDGFGGNGGWSWWIIILLLFANGGWGNGWNNNAGNGAMPYMMMNQYATQADVQSGFDQAAVIGGLNTINTTLTNGFSNAEISRANTLAAITGQMNNIAMQQMQGSFNNQLATTNLGAQIASEACADRASVTDGVRDLMAQNTANTQALLNTINGGIQAIQNQLCQDKIDSKNEQIANLQQELFRANLAASQNAQTAQILANNEAQTAALEQYLQPPVRPCYVVPNPNCCMNNGYNGCGCGN